MSATKPRLGSRRRRRGAVLVVMLTFAAIVSGLCVLTLSSSMNTYDTARTRLNATKAFYVADGGVDYVLGQLLADP